MDRSDDRRRDRPADDWQTDFVDALLHTGTFGDPHTRALLIWLTDAALDRPLPTWHAEDQVTATLQGVKLVRHCVHAPGGLQALATALRLLEPDGKNAQRVLDLAEEREPHHRPGLASPAAPALASGLGGPPPSNPPRPARNGRKDFFVSYTTVDLRWAVWMAWELEAAGFSVLLQEWDFVPGSNRQHGMERGMTECERTLAVLSPAYLESVYGRLEWQTAQGADPTGFARRLVPVRITPCLPDGLLATLVSIDLVGLTVEQARTRLLAGMRGALSGRSKPTDPPGFPG
ncbi:toll/interleukin-1 receptor domain-containing protein [Streptomyces sp. CA-249302]|uniref:toll/interleukin-1 receptor domain-containing protein n=1 Tax=Streptomyces sp. CA-249302 TaxID=3240058 RepID=UPI003D8C86DC